jgi:pimeloyl-ACP methyl ester carboxylesterase
MPSRDIKVGDRTLTIHEDGAPDGPAILHHHGTPLAGRPMDLWVEDARERGVRLVCCDRPGYGGSTPAPGRTVGDAAADAAAIMDELGVERFVTWGISGGGPHALACAALLPDRVAAVASLAGIAPFDAPGLNYFSGMGEDNIKEFGLTMAGREYIEPYAEAVGEMMRQGSVEQLAEGIASIISEVDRVALIDGGVGEFGLARCLRRLLRARPAGSTTTWHSRVRSASRSIRSAFRRSSCTGTRTKWCRSITAVGSPA